MEMDWPRRRMGTRRWGRDGPRTPRFLFLSLARVFGHLKKAKGKPTNILSFFFVGLEACCQGCPRWVEEGLDLWPDSSGGVLRQ